MNSKQKEVKKYLARLIGRPMQVDMDLETVPGHQTHHGEIGVVTSVCEDGTIKLLFDNGDSQSYEAGCLIMFGDKWEIHQLLMQDIDSMDRGELTRIRRILQLRKEHKEAEALALAMEEEPTREIFITWCDQWIQKRKEWKKLDRIVASYLEDPQLT